MPDAAPSGSIRTEIDGRIFKITVDNTAKKNAFTPDMMQQLSDAFTTFDGDDALWVAVLCFAGNDTTAGLDMPKFFGPNRERRDTPPANIDPFALRRRTMKPVVAAVQGLCLTVGIEMMLAADIVTAADTAAVRISVMRRPSSAATGSPLSGRNSKIIARWVGTSVPALPGKKLTSLAPIASAAIAGMMPK